MADLSEFSCTACGVQNCKSKKSKYPNFCPTTTKTTEEELNEVAAIYGGDTFDGKAAQTAARIEGEFYRQKTRVEETVLFIKRMGFKKVGIATCSGLLNEVKVLAKIFDKNDIDYYTVICKVGGRDKSEFGIQECEKVCKGGPETMCNPIMQARILNREKTEFNVVFGLCVGHDTLFIKHSEAPVTVLVCKDRVLGHNTVAALYSRYYANLHQ